MKFDSDRAHYYGQRGGLACFQRHGSDFYRAISILGRRAKLLKRIEREREWENGE